MLSKLIPIKLGFPFAFLGVHQLLILLRQEEMMETKTTSIINSFIVTSLIENM